MKRFLLLPNTTKVGCLDVVQHVVNILSQYDAAIYMDAVLLEHCPLKHVIPYHGDEQMDFAIVLGGDGSILDAAHLCISKDIPIIGVNLGTLGYLATVEADNLEILSRVFDSSYEIRELMTLALSHVKADKTITSCDCFAVNEISVMHDSFQGIAELLMIEPKHAECAYRCDGLILATPSGSTAYSLSAGGPIVDKDVEGICVTPICPHSHLTRPVIYSAKGAFTIKNITHSNDAVYACADGEMIFSVLPGESVVVEKSEKTLKIVTFEEISTIETLRKKMAKMEAGFYHEK